MQRLEVCYNNQWVMSEIRKAIDSVCTVVVNTDKLENRILNAVGKYLLKNDSHINNKTYIRRIIGREISEKALRHNFGTQDNISMSVLLKSDQDDDGSDKEFDIPDDNASVTETVELSEILSTLGAQDKRKAYVLNAWTAGVTDDTSIANGLAETLGGKMTGHRSFIKRFRKECRDTLRNHFI